MPSVVNVSQNFDQGFQSDIPRDMLGKNVAYRMKDWIPDNEAALRKRGGWAYACLDLAGVHAGPVRVVGLCWAPFAGSPNVVAVGDQGSVYKFSVYDATGGTYIADTTSGITGQLFFHRDRVIIPAPVGSDTAPRKYDNATLAVVGGTPPNFSNGCSWGDYIIGANGYVGGVRYDKRAWWSGVGTPDVWAPSTSYLDFPEEIVAMTPRGSVLLFFGYGGTHLVTGSLPPPGGDFSVKRYQFAQGTFDGRTVANYRDWTVWANNTGVWRTDGTSLTDLTDKGGISLFWQALMANFNPNTGWRAAAGVYRGSYIITVINNAGAEVATLACDLDNITWTQFTNIKATCFAHREGGAGTSTAAGSEELFLGWYGGARVNKVSPLWSPSQSDGNGAAILPVLETPYYILGSSSLKRMHYAFVTYDMRGGGTFVVDKLVDPAGAYVQLAEALPSTTARERHKSPIRERVQGVALRFTQSAVSDDTRFHRIDLATHALEPVI